MILLSDEEQEWLCNGERGLSSESIFYVMTGLNLLGRWGAPERNYPHDPDDFKRCELLLRAIPKFRNNLDKMSQLGGPWSRLVPKWDEISRLLEQEIPSIWGPECEGNAPKTYAFIRNLIKEAA